MLKEGMFIQERYEVISKIGSGGMADVYKAKDNKLNRFVAVKVLKPEFRADRAFISKFRVEAQSAAGLAHANIVNVYDVGEENGISYIVMELVEGITLKEYIEKKGRLAVREATSIAIQVSMGLQAAHNNGIVHRDVKPQNIIISTDGKVKVTDFGIARAASSDTISSNVMGSVHYSSPEQVRGGYSDYKSDIYSLGITLYEMLTGHVPFDGETTVAIAIKHLQEEMQSPRKYVPDLPKSSVQIIYKCTQKSPDRRYVDMEELIADLKESLVNPEGDFVKIAALNNHAQTVMVSKEELHKIKESRNEVQPPDETYQNVNPHFEADPNQGRTPDMNQNMAGGQQYGAYQNYNNNNPNTSGYYDETEDDEDDSGVNPKLEKFMTIGSIVLGALILCIFLALVGSAAGLFDLGFLAGGSKKETEIMTETVAETIAETSGQVEVPSILGMSEDEAKEFLADYGLGLDYAGEEPSNDYAEGEIMIQQPTAGEMVDKNTTISYVVSTGSDLIAVPDLENETISDAEKKLSDLGLKCEQEYVYDIAVAEGRVSYTSPGTGTEVDPGSVVTIYISKGSENIIDESETDEEITEEVPVIDEPESDEDIPDQETEAPEIKESFSTDIRLKAPEGYDGEAVRIEMEQDGQTTTLVDGEAVEFPYRVKMDSESDSNGTAYVYVLDSEGNITKKVVYENVPFK